MGQGYHPGSNYLKQIIKYLGTNNLPTGPAVKFKLAVFTVSTHT